MVVAARSVAAAISSGIIHLVHRSRGIHRNSMKQDWLEIAKNLPCGGKTKEVCCGNSPSCLISHSEKGYSAHCFRCPEGENHKFQPHGQRSIAEIQRHKRELEENKNKPPYLPSDFTLDIPAKYAWFLKYGISLATAREYRFGYSEFFHRIVIPIYNTKDELVAVHLRAINPDDKPKYLNLGKPKDSVLFWAIANENDTRLVIVEDVLSAIKVKLAGYNAVALNGSNMTDYQAVLLASDHVRYMWLDNDPAGIKGAREAVSQLFMQATAEVRMVKSERDPKTYNKDEIRLHLEEAKVCLT